MIPSLSFPSGAGYVSASGAFSTDALGAVRLRFRVLAVPTSASGKWIAGHTAAAANGWLVWTSTSGMGESVGEIQVYVALDGVLTRVARKFLVAEQIGQLVTLHIVMRSLVVHVYIDGQEIGDGAVTTGFGKSFTTYNKGSGTLSVGVDGGLSIGCEQGFVELALGSTELTDAQVLADARLPIGAAMVGEAHHWTATSQVGASGSNLSDVVGSADLTVHGSPTVAVSTQPARPQTLATLNLFGDSTCAGYDPNNSANGDGWRRSMQKALALRGLGVSLVGFSAQTIGDFDFDLWSNGSDGQALSQELATLAADLTNAGGAFTSVLFAYGLNDLIAQNRTAAQLATDMSTAAGLVAAARPGVACGFCCPWDVASGSATSGQHTQLRITQQQWEGTILTVQAANPLVRVFSVRTDALITNPNDTTQLVDGVHPSASMYATLGADIAKQVGQALWGLR